MKAHSGRADTRTSWHDGAIPRRNPGNNELRRLFSPRKKLGQKSSVADHSKSSSSYPWPGRCFRRSLTNPFNKSVVAESIESPSPERYSGSCESAFRRCRFVTARKSLPDRSSTFTFILAKGSSSKSSQTSNSAATLSIRETPSILRIPYYYCSPNEMISTLQPCCYQHRRMTRGQCGALLLHCAALSSATPCRLSPALSLRPLCSSLFSPTLLRKYCFHSFGRSIHSARNASRQTCNTS